MSEIDAATIARLIEDVQRLNDLEAIKRLRYAYFRCMDTANIDEFRELFVPDFTCRYEGSSYLYEARNRDEFVEMIADSFNADCAMSHMGHHPEIDITGADDATGRWYLQDVVYKYRTNEAIYGTAIYTDRYRRTADGWRISYSEYFRIVEVVEFPIRPPQFTGRWLADHGRKLPPA